MANLTSWRMDIGEFVDETTISSRLHKSELHGMHGRMMATDVSPFKFAKGHV